MRTWNHGRPDAIRPTEPPGRAAVREDRGSALIMAVLVSVVVFVIGATWTSMASHESSASNTDRRRQQAIDAAMAGLVLADSALATNANFTATGLLPFTGGGAEFEVTVAAETPGGFRRIITSIGYSPSKAEQVKTVRTVQQVVDLGAPGFTYGIFSEGTLLTGSSSTVIGDVYTNGDIVLGNSQDYIGNLSTRGSIVTGSNQTITGTVRAGGSISINSSSTKVYGSAYAGGNIATGGTVRDTAQAGGTIGCSKVLGICLPNSPPPPVPEQHLPTFTWNPSNYPTVPYEYSNGAVMVAEVASGMKTQGVFHVVGSGSAGDVIFRNNDTIRLTGDMTIVASGSVTLPKSVVNNATGGQAVQLTVISTATGGASNPGEITSANNLTIPSTVRTLFFTRGEFDGTNSSKFTGAMYVGGITAGAHVDVTYAPVSAPGFTWSGASAQTFTIRNVSTREISNGS